MSDTVDSHINEIFHTQKISFNECLSTVKDDINVLANNLTNYIPCKSKTAQEIVDYFFKSNGKLIRPALFYLSANLCKYNGAHRHELAAASELIHSASLLHDDVIDDSSLRRNQASSHTLWGKESSILVGDLIYSRASELVAKSGKINIVNDYARTIRKMSEGELIQLENIYNDNISVDTYFQIITFKTAELMSMVCKSAAQISDLGKDAENALESYGKNIGISFQLLDDALDYISDSKKSGKESSIDFANGKLTYPLIVVRENSTKEEWNKVKSLLDSNHTDQRQEFILNLIMKYNATDATLDLAEKHTKIAQQALNHFDDDELKKPLLQLAQTLQIRNY